MLFSSGLPERHSNEWGNSVFGYKNEDAIGAIGWTENLEDFGDFGTPVPNTLLVRGESRSRICCKVSAL